MLIGAEIISNENEAVEKVQEYKRPKPVCYNCGNPLSTKVEFGFVVYKCKFCGAHIKKALSE